MPDSNDYGFIETYRNLILNDIPTSRDWAESVATGLLSTAMGCDRKITTQIGALPLNVWQLVIGRSGSANKTAPLKYFATPTIIQASKDIKFPLQFPTRFTMEGMIEYLTKYPSMGIIIRDDFTGFLKEAKGKGYMRNIPNFLNEMYDGKIQKKYTLIAKLEEPKNVYVTFLGATTPLLFQVMKSKFFFRALVIGYCIYLMRAILKQSPNYMQKNISYLDM